jgi:hypothetical protein
VEVLTVGSGMEMMIWNMALTALVALLGFFARSKFNEIDRVALLLNKTREEVARDHITRAEYSRELDKLMDRFDAGVLRLEHKIDELHKYNVRDS